MSGRDSVKKLVQEVEQRLEALVELIDGDDPEKDAEVFAAAATIGDHLEYLESRCARVVLAYPPDRFDAEGQIGTASGAIERYWSSGSVHWDWASTTSAYAGYAARVFGIPEDLARKIVEDMAATIGPAKSKAWRQGALEDREIYRGEMRRSDGGHWKAKIVRPTRVPRQPKESSDGK